MRERAPRVTYDSGVSQRQSGEGDWLGRGPVTVAADRCTRLELLGAFRLVCDGAPVNLPGSARRLLAFVGSRHRSVPRRLVAAALWPDLSERRTQACLRSALWRLRSAAGGVVVVEGELLATADGIVIDVAVLEARAHAAMRMAAPPTDVRADLRLLAQDLLPDWSDDWLVFERERLRQLRLHALEQLSTALLGAGRCGEAIEAAQLAIDADPLRESAHAAVVRAHMAEGNHGDAVTQLRRCRELLARELGLDPTTVLADLTRAIPGVMGGVS